MGIVIDGYAFVNGDSGDTGSSSILVPATTILLVAFWNHWDGNARGLTQFALNSVPFTIHENQQSSGSGLQAAGVATLQNPTTGSSVPFDWDWLSVSGAVDQGGDIFFVCLSGTHDSSPVSDTAVAGALSSTNPGPITLTPFDANDLILGMASNGANTAPALGSGQTILNSWQGVQNGSHFTDIFMKDVTNTPTSDLTMGSPNYAALCGISIRQAVAGANPTLMGRACM